MDKDLISIIVPVYNVEMYLSRCLESVISQTYKNIEIILVDDGSTDNSGKTCDEYADNDTRIMVIHQKNCGQALARNNAIQYASGDYILYVDSDDILTIDHVKHLVYLKEKYGADLVQCEMMKFRSENQLIELGQVQRECMDNKEELFCAQEALKQFSYQKKFTPSPWCKLIKRELMDGLMFPVGVGYEDMAVMYKVIGKAGTLVYSPKVCYYYRQHRNSTMHTKFSDKKIDRIRIAEQFLKYMKENYPESLVSAYTRYDLAQLQLLMELPFSNEFNEIKKTAYKNLKSTRGIVIHDKDTPNRLKLMVMASYFGPTVLMLLGRAYMSLTNR